jgi:hypothetical protein
MSPVTQLPAALLPAIKPITAVAATDIFTSTNHGLAIGDSVTLSGLVGGAGINPALVHYVIAANFAASTFQLSTTLNGSTIDMTTDLTAGNATTILNWGNLRKLFTNEQLSYLAKYFQTVSPAGGLVDGTILDNAVVRNFYQNGQLPL